MASASHTSCHCRHRNAHVTLLWVPLLNVVFGLRRYQDGTGLGLLAEAVTVVLIFFASGFGRNENGRFCGCRTHRSGQGAAGPDLSSFSRLLPLRRPAISFFEGQASLAAAARRGEHQTLLPSTASPASDLSLFEQTGQGWAVGFPGVAEPGQSGTPSPCLRAWLAVRTGKGVSEGPPPDLRPLRPSPPSQRVSAGA